MTWTNDAPTKVGIYWFRKSPEKRHSIVSVYRYDLNGRLVVSDPDGWSTYLDDHKKEYPNCQWSDTPIPEPEEAKI